MLITDDRSRPFGARSLQLVAQGSQSLTLGLTMIAAPQLGECSPLNIVLPSNR